MRRRLALVVLATTALVTIAFVLPLGWTVRSAARERALAQAREATQVLVPALAQGDAATTELAVASAASMAPGAVTVMTGDGSILGVPANGDAGLERARSGSAFIAATDDGVFLYTPVLTRDPSRVAVIRVHVPGAALRRGVTASWVTLAGLGVVLIVGAILVADRLGRSTVRATRGLATTARRLSSGDLDARAVVDGPPEVADVATALNDLATQIRELLAAERESAADLSHRLRTPMTALRIDVGELEESELSRRLARALDDLERQVDRVIRDTRRPPGQRADALDVGLLVAERAAFWAPLAEDQGRPWQVDVAPGAVTTGDGDELAAALDALLGNVFAHTPEGTGCRIAAETSGGRVLVVVEDAGPGFGDDRLLERGESSAGSTGLGLDIVRRMAEHAGGDLTVGRSRLGGAKVVLNLPRS